MFRRLHDSRWLLELRQLCRLVRKFKCVQQKAATSRADHNQLATWQRRHESGCRVAASRGSHLKCEHVLPRLLGSIRSAAAASAAAAAPRTNPARAPGAARRRLERAPQAFRWQPSSHQAAYLIISRRTERSSRRRIHSSARRLLRLTPSFSSSRRRRRDCA